MADQPLDENAPTQGLAIYPQGGERPGKWNGRRVGAAASLSLVVLIGAGAMIAHVHALSAVNVNTALEQRLDAVSKRLEALEASRAHDEIASLRKAMADIKGGAHEVGARLEKLEKDENARFDKLAERLDRAAAAGKLGELAARLDKLETKATTVAVAPAKPSPPLKPSAGVSNETTGSIGKPQGRLRGYWISEVHNGYATIDSRDGEFEAAPGDVLPGVGRVLRIERQGRDWVVLTTEGRIEAARD